MPHRPPKQQKKPKRPLIQRGSKVPRSVRTVRRYLQWQRDLGIVW